MHRAQEKLDDRAVGARQELAHGGEGRTWGAAARGARARSSRGHPRTAFSFASKAGVRAARAARRGRGQVPAERGRLLAQHGFALGKRFRDAPSPGDELRRASPAPSRVRRRGAHPPVSAAHEDARIERVGLGARAKVRRATRRRGRDRGTAPRSPAPAAARSRLWRRGSASRRRRDDPPSRRSFPVAPARTPRPGNRRAPRGCPAPPRTRGRPAVVLALEQAEAPADS